MEEKKSLEDIAAQDRGLSEIEEAVAGINGDRGIDEPPSGQSDYERHTELFRRFMETCDTGGHHEGAPEYYEEPPAQDFSFGAEVIDYGERVLHVRAIQANALLQGSHNYVDPRRAEEYKWWTMASKFNLLMSFSQYDHFLSL